MFEIMSKDPQVFKRETEAEADAIVAALQKIKPDIKLQKLESEEVLDSSGKKVTDILKPGTVITSYP